MKNALKTEISEILGYIQKTLLLYIIGYYINHTNGIASRGFGFNCLFLRNTNFCDELVSIVLDFKKQQELIKRLFIYFWLQLMPKLNVEVDYVGKHWTIVHNV